MAEDSSVKQIWSDALDPQLLQRLLQRVERPGVCHARLAEAILSRLHGMPHPLSLLADLARRYDTGTAQVEETPIVFVQPARRADDGYSDGGRIAAPVLVQQSPSLQGYERQPDGAHAAAPPQRIIQERTVQPAAPQDQAANRTPANLMSPVTHASPSASPARIVSVSAQQDHAVAVERPLVRRAAAQVTPSPIVYVRQAPRDQLSSPEARAELLPPAVTSQAPSTSTTMTTIHIRKLLQRAVQQPIVTHTHSFTRHQLPVPLVLAAPGASVNGNPLSFPHLSGEGVRPLERRANPRVSDRLGETASGQLPRFRSPSADEGTHSPAVSPSGSQSGREPGIDVTALAERVQRELNMEQLAEKVQRQLRRRLAVERERRGWARWT
jgi:hypothetical protein